MQKILNTRERERRVSTSSVKRFRTNVNISCAFNIEINMLHLNRWFNCYVSVLAQMRAPSLYCSFLLLATPAVQAHMHVYTLLMLGTHVIMVEYIILVHIELTCLPTRFRLQHVRIQTSPTHTHTHFDCCINQGAHSHTHVCFFHLYASCSVDSEKCAHMRKGLQPN